MGPLQLTDERIAGNVSEEWQAGEEWHANALSEGSQLKAWASLYLRLNLGVALS